MSYVCNIIINIQIQFPNFLKPLSFRGFRNNPPRPPIYQTPGFTIVHPIPMTMSGYDPVTCTIVVIRHHLPKNNSLLRCLFCYCYRMVFRWRTFYMYATTEKECNDWVSLINWRLVRITSVCLSVCLVMLVTDTIYLQMFTIYPNNYRQNT